VVGLLCNGGGTTPASGVAGISESCRNISLSQAENSDRKLDRHGQL